MYYTNKWQCCNRKTQEGKPRAASFTDYLLRERLFFITNNTKKREEKTYKTSSGSENETKIKEIFSHTEKHYFPVLQINNTTNTKSLYIHVYNFDIYIYIHIYLYIYTHTQTNRTLAWWLECLPMAWETWVQSQVELYQRHKK